jgi:hypothetical protein
MKFKLMSILLLALSVSFVGCKDSSGNVKKPSAKQKKVDDKNPNGYSDNKQQGDLDANGVAGSGIKLTPSNFQGTEMEAIKGSPVEMRFKLEGGNADDYDVGINKGPTGATVNKTGSDVVFKWASAVGVEQITFVIRNMNKCREKENGNSAACEISKGFGTSVTVNRDYDTVSSQFVIKIKDSGITNGNGFGAGAGAGAGGGGGGNDQLIQQIVGLLGGGGGGGGGGGITDLLSGLGGGQLQQILGQLQGGGGGGGITQLLGILGNIQ